ncbi:MAG: hypothetical protein ACYTBZ_29495, partial [Planctomycetota bacterium]
SAATRTLKVSSCGSGELLFASAFLFAASPSCEGGEKRTTAKNKYPQLLSAKRLRNMFTANQMQVVAQKQRCGRWYYKWRSQPHS